MLTKHVEIDSSTNLTKFPNTAILNAYISGKCVVEICYKTQK